MDAESSCRCWSDGCGAGLCGAGWVWVANGGGTGRGKQAGVLTEKVRPLLQTNCGKCQLDVDHKGGLTCRPKRPR